MAVQTTGQADSSQFPIFETRRTCIHRLTPHIPLHGIMEVKNAWTYTCTEDNTPRDPLLLVTRYLILYLRVGAL